MSQSSRSFVHTPLLVALVMGAAAFATAAGAGWPMWLRVTATILALILVALALQGPTIARALRPVLGIRLGDALERFLGDRHQAGTKRRCITVLLLMLSASLVWAAFFGGGQWAYTLGCVALGALAFYWGCKVCRGGWPKRRAASIAVGGYLLSLSANFLAGAATGSTSLDSSIASFHTKLDTLLASNQRIEEHAARIETGVDAARGEIAGVHDSLDEMRRKVDEFLAQSKLPGMDPASQPVPADVLEAAHELMKSKSARERAAAAIVLKQWEAADREIAELNKGSVLAEAFEIKTLEGNRYYAAQMFDEAIAPYDVAFGLQPHNFTARNNLASALLAARGPGTNDRLQRAIQILETTSSLVGISSYTWAWTQTMLGEAWSRLPTGDETENNIRAIQACTAALDVYTREAMPMDWAWTQRVLGKAWSHIPTGDRAENQNKAIAAYTAALEVHTRDAAPLDWAADQNNLGNAWSHLPSGDQTENRMKAIAAYTAALEVYTRENSPMQWARVQNNLGNAWSHLPSGDQTENQTKAIAAYTAALEVYSRESEPLEWARVQNNLGNAWSHLPSGDQTDNQTKAIAALGAALQIRTRVAAPRDWAATQNNLGNAWADLAEQPGQDRCGLLRMAIACDKAALLVRTPKALPDDHAQTSRNLERHRARYEELGCHTGPNGVAFDDIEPAK